MARHQKHTFGQILIAGSTESAVNALVKDGNENILICTGTSVPSATAGFAKGCLFIKTDAGASVSSVYENIGTTASCSFNLMGAVSAGEITLAEGSILVGNNAGVATALSAKGDTKILVGNATTITSVLVSGDVTMSNLGAFTIGAKKVLNTMIAAAAGTVLIGTKTSGDVTAVDNSAAGSVVIGQGGGETCVPHVLSGDITMGVGGVTAIGANKVVTAMILDANVTAAKLANGAGLAALFTAGLGGSGSWVKTDTGVKTIHTGTAGTKKVFIICTVTEAFTGAGDQTTFKIGQVGTDDKFAATSLFTDAILNKVFVVCGELTASTNLIVTVAPAAGAGTGGLAVAAIILPATV